jgi:magnesium-transporting ATPase (P-type)
MIPADVSLIASKDMFVSQASLTGESLPVEKFDTCPAESLQGSPLDLPNICLMGTNVVSGTAQAVVVATGGSTYFGSLARGVVGQRVDSNFGAVADGSDLTLVGILAFLDPPKESATPALAALREHGVQVRVLTGDNGAVIKKVCKEVDLSVERVVLGP